MDPLTLTDRAGDTLRVFASCGEVDLNAIQYDGDANSSTSALICLSRKQTKRLRKYLKELLREPGLVENR